jgi:hypothetical protein
MLHGIVPRIAYETLLGLLIDLLMLALTELFERPSFPRALAAGLVLGITVLCRGLYILFPLALLPALFVRMGLKQIRNGILYTIALVLMMSLTLSPWVVRNYTLSHEFVPATTQGGTNFFIGNEIIRHYSFCRKQRGLGARDGG